MWVNKVFKFCAVDEELNVFLFFEMLGQSWGDLRVACPLIGEEDFTERLKFYFKFLYQVNQLHSLGLVHCDLKLDNVLFARNRYDAFTIIDFGFASDSVCLGGTPKYAPPEYIAGVEGLAKGTDTFGVSYAQKHDAFSAGLIILLMEADIEAAEAVMQAYATARDVAGEDYKTYLKLAKPFATNVVSVLRSSMARRFKTSSSSSTVGALEKHFAYLLAEIVKGMMNFDYEARLPVSVALFQLFAVYNLVKTPRNHVLEANDLFYKEEYLKTELSNPQRWTELNEFADRLFEDESRSLQSPNQII